MNVVGIVSALAAEAYHLGPAARWSGELGTLADGTLVVISGMGCAAAARAADRLVKAGATALTSWGLAGGLDPALPSGTVCLPSEVIAGDGTALPTERSWRERLIGAIASHHPVTGGKLLTLPQAIQSVADKAQAFRQTGAAAVDMESVAVAEIARQHGLPFIAVRVIVDTAGDSLPRAAMAAATGEGRLNVGRLLRALVAAPGEIPALIQLALRYRAARRALAAIGRLRLLGPT